MAGLPTLSSLGGLLEFGKKFGLGKKYDPGKPDNDAALGNQNNGETTQSKDGSLDILDINDVDVGVSPNDERPGNQGTGETVPKQGSGSLFSKLGTKLGLGNDKKDEPGKPDNDAAPEEGIPSKMKCKKLPEGASMAFKLIYKLSAYVLLVLLIALFLMGIIDIIHYHYNENLQQKNIDINTRILFKDTTDISTLVYLKPDVNTELYNILLQQKCIAILMTIAGICIIVLGIHISYFVGMGISASFSGTAFEEELDVPQKHLAAVLFGGVAGAILNSYYKKNFVDETQASLKTNRDYLRSLRTSMYDMMIARDDYLRALRENDMVVVENIMIELSKRCAQRASSSETCLEMQKAVFTFNLYKYLTNNIPDADPAYSELLQIFTIQNVKARKINPVDFFYYKDAIFIPNTWQTYGFAVNRMFVKQDRTRNDDVAQRMSQSLQGKMDSLNARFAQLNTMSNGKKRILQYSYMLVVYSFLLALIMGFILFSEKLAEFFNSLWEKIKAIFSKSKESAQ
jgi:hypothetical protein